MEDKWVWSMVEGTNADVMRRIERLYFEPGIVIADVTYGHGSFWKGIDISRYDFRPSDLTTYRKLCHVRKYDFRKLPYEDRTIDVVVFDPPFCRQAFGWYKAAYQTDRFDLQPAAVTQVYEDGIREATRVLTDGGLLVVKCGNGKQGNRQRWNEIDVFNFANGEGTFWLYEEAADRFELKPDRKHSPNTKKAKTQSCAYKSLTYFWVFRKKDWLYTAAQQLLAKAG